MNKRFISLLITAALLVTLSNSCSEKDDPDQLPELPPVEALMMDFSEFIGNPAQQGAMQSVVSIENALYSYLTVSFWSAMVTLPMVVPVAAYLKSFENSPVYLGDNSWKWTYSVTAGNDTYIAELVTKRISNEEFTAEMFITKQGEFEDFKWFEGTVRYDRTHAEWTMYESPVNNVAWLDIEWNMDWEKEISDITYTVVKTGIDETGSYIKFGIVEDDTYDAYYTISWSEGDTFIEWNRDTGAGRVKDESHFGDALWHCWNEQFQDVDCS
jgi:hypothetical protein